MKCENCGKNEVTFVYRSNVNGHVEEKTREVTVVRHHEDTPFAPGPVQKQHLF